MEEYRILGINPDADEDTIENAYRDKVKETHPDLGGSADDFMRVKEAYETICDEGQDNMDLKSSEDLIYRYPAEVNFVDYQKLSNSYSDPDIDDMKSYFEDNETESFTVNGDQSILEAAEGDGNSWPYSCRGGACTNCVVRVVNGRVSTPGSYILTDELLEKGYRLTCIGKPLSRDIDVVYNIRDRPELKDLLLPTRR